MNEFQQPNPGQPGPSQPRQPSPATAAAEAAARNSEPGAPADHPALVSAAALLEEASMVRAAADDELDLGALARQAELLSSAHDRLVAALEDAGRG